MADEPDHDELCEREQRFLLDAIDRDVDLSDHMDDAVKSLQIVSAADRSDPRGAGDRTLNRTGPDRIMTDRRAAAWIDRFNEALEEGDPRDVASLFGEECYWRDLLAFTWNVKTMHGRDAIESMLDATLARLRPIRFEPAETPRETSEWIEVVLSFETPSPGEPVICA